MSLRSNAALIARCARARPAVAPRQSSSTARLAGRRSYATPGGETKVPPASAPAPAGSSSSTPLYLGGLAVALGGAAFYFFGMGQSPEGQGKNVATAVKGAKATVEAATGMKRNKEDYQEVYNAIAESLEKEDHDDGSMGPVLLRLAWHCSGTYDKTENTGGSDKATMRFKPESEHGANNGLNIARDHMQTIKEKFPWISYGDLWTLGGVAAVQELGGPVIKWRPGRIDGYDYHATPDGRLPDATQQHDHLRKIFYRMGFNDQEIVALSGAHALGRCHTDRSGFDGPWDFSPTTMSNEYFRLLVEESWVWRDWKGPKQYTDKSTKTLMMLPTDMALVKDKSFRKTAEIYAKDEQAFFKDFAAVVGKLFELGVPTSQFPVKEGWSMQTLEAQADSKK